MEMCILSGYDCLNLSIFSHNFVPYVVVGDISPFKDSFSYHCYINPIHNSSGTNQLINHIKYVH
jgi:hypothetical protein